MRESDQQHPLSTASGGRAGVRGQAAALWFSLVLSVFAPPGGSAASLVASGTYNGHTYEIYQVSGGVSWHDAEDECETRGDHLVVITSSAENSFVYSLLDQSGAPIEPWLGLTDEAQEGTWRWVNGERIQFTNWAKGSPSGRSGGGQRENLIEMLGDGTWNDNRDHTSKYIGGFICEWE